MKKQWECLEKENNALRQDIKNLEQEILVLKTLNRKNGGSLNDD